MSEIRGEKTVFRKQDMVALHSLPSAQANDPLILRTPARRSMTRRATRLLIVLFSLCLLMVSGVVFAIESGAFDRVLNARAQTALNAAIGGDFHADVESTRLRLTSSGRLALQGQNVTLVDNASQKRIVTTNSVAIELDPLALLTGRIAVSRLEADGATLDPALLPKGGPLDLTKVKISDTPEALEAVFRQMDAVSRMIARSNTKLVRIADLKLSMAGPRQRIVSIVVNQIDFTRGADGTMQITGAIDIDGQRTGLNLKAIEKTDRIVEMTGMANSFPLSALLYRIKTDTEPPFGVESSADLKITAIRGIEKTDPALEIHVDTGEGVFNAGGLTSALKASQVTLAYDFKDGAIDIRPSIVRVGRSTFPFSGAIGDLDPPDVQVRKGFSLALSLKGASSWPEDVDEAPLIFDGNAKGRFLSDTHELVFDNLTIASKAGSLQASSSILFGEKSPEMRLLATASTMETAAIKQIWPWWIGKNARKWLIGNVFGGQATDARIEVFIRKGRLTDTVGPVDLDESELTVGFNISGARVNVAGQIPPLSDTKGAVTLKGGHLAVKVENAISNFPSGRSVTVTGGDFLIPKSHEKPLMAEVKMQLAGQADAIAELATFRPIQALQHTSFKPEDFSGSVTADIGARIGLLKAQNPPPPQWQTEMQLDGVALKPPISGRAVSAVKGTLRIDPEQANLDATADIDGIPMTLTVVEPVGKDSPIKRMRHITGTIEEDGLQKLAPGLSSIIDGPVDLDLSIDQNEQQTVSVNLDKAALSLPWIGWSKGRGIDATASFSVQTAGKITKINMLKIEGDSFDASGNLEIDGSGLSSVKFDRVRLSSGDDYAVSVRRQKNGYGVIVDGEAADVRPVIESLRAPGGKPDDSPPLRIAIEASLKKVRGFNKETLSNVNFSYASRGKQIDAVNLSAVTDSGQAVIVKLIKSGADNVLELTSGDAGSLTRFIDLYANMRGGLINLKLRDRGANSWRGTLDIRKFSLVNEARLQSIVSTPADAQGRSLNQAVRKDVDVSSARFERGSADLEFDDGTVAIRNGMVRGGDIGATFQGTLRDKNAKMDMTGTFMPAYGLNRLFGELPLIGAILGNGRDRGLIGITFRVSGSFEKPALQINPLSIIAPGVFRSIFEY